MSLFEICCWLVKNFKYQKRKGKKLISDRWDFCWIVFPSSLEFNPLNSPFNRLVAPQWRRKLSSHCRFTKWTKELTRVMRIQEPWWRAKHCVCNSLVSVESHLCSTKPIAYGLLVTTTQFTCSSSQFIVAVSYSTTQGLENLSHLLSSSFSSSLFKAIQFL